MNFTNKFFKIVNSKKIYHCLFIALFILLIVNITSINTVFAKMTIECHFRDGSCLPDETVFLYANKNFADNTGKVLSSNVAVIPTSNYNKFLCCKSNYGNLSISFKPKIENCTGGDELMFFTSQTNARIRFTNYDQYKSISLLPFNINNYQYKSCVYNPKGFSFFDIEVSDRNLNLLGYSCLYKISDIENGLVSDCSAKFNGNNKYQYTVWGRLWEDIDSLKCSNDCTSKLDGRVYVMCGKKIKQCQDVPLSCNGALLDTWVPEVDKNGVLTGKEILCSAPWNKHKAKIFTDQGIKVDVSKNCTNLISKTYSVLVDNQKVNMVIYMCED